MATPLIAVSDPEYHTRALNRYRIISEELSQLHRELAQLVAAEVDGRIQAYLNSEETSVQARDREASAFVVGHTVEVIRLKGEVSALEEEKSYLLYILSIGT